MAIIRKLFMGEPIKHFGPFLRVYLACLLAVSTAMLVVRADPPTGNGSPGVTITTPNNTLTVGGTSFNPTLDLNLGTANTWTAAQTFPSIFDTGIPANSQCLGTDATSQLIARGSCGSGGSTNISSTATTIAVGVSTPTVVQAVQNTNLSSSVTFTSTPTVGNLMVCFATNLSAAPTPNTGWTQIDTLSGVAHQTTTVYRVVQAGDLATETPVTGGGGSQVGCWEVTGESSTAPIQVHSLAEGSSTNPPTVTTGSVTPTATNSLALVAAVEFSNAYGVAPAPSGTTSDASETTQYSERLAHQGTLTTSPTTWTFTWPTASTSGTFATAAAIVINPSSSNTNIDLSTTQPASRATTWLSSQTFAGVNNYEPSSVPCTGAPSLLVTGVCIAGNDGTNNLGIVLGPQLQSAGGMGCVSSCTAASSMKLCFYPMRTTGVPTAACDYYTSTGTRILGGGILSTNLNPILTGPVGHGGAQCAGTSPVTSSAGIVTCSVTSATSTATLNFGTPFSQKPVCYASDETAAAALKVVPATGSVTVTGQGASDVIDIQCFGNAS